MSIRPNPNDEIGDSDFVVSGLLRIGEICVRLPYSLEMLSVVECDSSGPIMTKPRINPFLSKIDIRVIILKY